MKTFGKNIALRSKVICGVLAWSLILTTACGKGVSTLSPSFLKTESGTDTSQDIEQNLESSPEFQKINLQMDSVELQSLKVDAEVAKLSQISLLKFNLKNLKDLVKNFKSYVERLQKTITDLKQKIQDQLAQLDLQDPAQQALIEKLKKALEMLEKIEQKLHAVLVSMHDLVENLFQKIEEKLAQIGSSNPALSIFLKILLETLKKEILKKLPIP